MLSVVPPHTKQPGGKPARCAASAVTEATGAPGTTTVVGSTGAKGCRGSVGGRHALAAVPITRAVGMRAAQCRGSLCGWGRGGGHRA